MKTEEREAAVEAAHTGTEDRPRTRASGGDRIKVRPGGAADWADGLVTVTGPAWVAGVPYNTTGNGMTRPAFIPAGVTQVWECTWHGCGHTFAQWRRHD